MDFGVNSLLQLLDSRKAGKLNTENFLLFMQSLSQAPSIDDAHKLFRSFDTSNSGELDAQAFHGLLNALEALLNRPMSVIIKEFLAKQFEKFFLTVCEISKSPSATSPKPIKERYIDKKDVQTAMESSNMFPEKWNSNDKINLFKKRFTYNTLSFDDFCTLFATCIEGKNLADIFRAFEDAQARRSAARSAFDGSGGGAGPASRLAATGPAGGVVSRIAALSPGEESPKPANLARPPPPPPRVPEIKNIPIAPNLNVTAPGNKSVVASAAKPNIANAAAGPAAGGGKPGDDKKAADEQQQQQPQQPIIPEVKLSTGLAFLAQPLQPNKDEQEKKRKEEEAKRKATEEKAKAEAQQTQIDPKLLKECFALMDMRKSGGLRVEDALFFCEHLPQAPVVSTIRKIYKDCDADGSGEIEPDEFLDFCLGLERITNMKAADMMQAVVKEMYRRLFEMADEDKGGTISREELHLLMDCVSGMKASEVERVTRSFPDELSLDDFCEVIKRLTKGRSIAEVTASFAEGRARRAASEVYSKKLAEKKDEPAAGDCPECAEKKKKVASLLSQVEALQAQADAQAEKKNAKRTRRFTVSRKESDSGFPSLESSDILRGNLWETMHFSVNVFSAPFYSGCSALARPLLLRLTGSRIAGVADSIALAARETRSNADAAARWINDSSKIYFDATQELRVITDTFKVEVKAFQLLYEKLLATVTNNTEFSTSTTKQLCEEILTVRKSCASMRPDLERCTDTVVDLRVEAANRILCAAPFTNIPAEMARCSGVLEQSTARLREMIAVSLQLGSMQLSDVEVWARRLLEKTHDRVSQDSALEMKAFLATSLVRLSPDAINEVLRELDDTFRDAQHTLRRTATYRRDKGVMTLSEEEVQAELDQLRRQEMERNPDAHHHDDGSKARGGAAAAAASVGIHADPGAMSPARVRRMLDRSVDSIKEIDRALTLLLKDRPDVPLPKNFQRVDPTGNAFQFGTRVIELVPIDRAAAVKVGGGYMFLEEFCKRNYEQEVRKLEWANKRFETTKVEIGRNATGGLDLRGGSKSGSMTPRNVVRKTPR